MDIESVIIYSSVLLLAIFFSYNIKNVVQKRVMLVFSFLVIFIFTAIRFNVGNDYNSYITNFYTIRNSGKYIHEFGFFLPSLLLKDYIYGYLAIFALFAFFTYFFLFKALLKEKILVYGILFIFTTNFLYMSNDQVRQGLAIAIFIYSIKFIKSRDINKYVITILLTTMIVHYSSIVLLPIYFIDRINFSTRTWILLLVTFTVLSYAGVFSKLTVYVIKNIPYYGEHYTNAAGGRLLVPEKLNSGLAHLFWILTAFFIVFKRNVINDNVFFTIYIFGILLYLMFYNYLLTQRVTYFFTYTNIVVFSLYVKNERKIFYKQIFLAGVISFFLLSIAKNANRHGAFPYKSFITSKINYVKKNRVPLNDSIKNVR